MDFILFFLKAIPPGSTMCELFYSFMISTFLISKIITHDPMPFIFILILDQNIVTQEEKSYKYSIHLKNLICKDSA